VFFISAGSRGSPPLSSDRSVSSDYRWRRGASGAHLGSGTASPRPLRLSEA
jgi:hypothetical protein